MTLTPQQLDHLRKLLAYELRAVSHTAMDEGASAQDVAGMLDERRRQVRARAGDDKTPGDSPQ